MTRDEWRESSLVAWLAKPPVSQWSDEERESYSAAYRQEFDRLNPEA
jgi:hypothetical protein